MLNDSRILFIVILTIQLFNLFITNRLRGADEFENSGVTNALFNFATAIVMFFLFILLFGEWPTN